MSSFSVFMMGASCAVIALLQYLKRYYTVIPKEQTHLTMKSAAYELLYRDPAQGQVVREWVYDVTPERHQELTPTEG